MNCIKDLVASMPEAALVYCTYQLIVHYPSHARCCFHITWKKENAIQIKINKHITDLHNGFIKAPPCLLLLAPRFLFLDLYFSLRLF